VKRRIFTIGADFLGKDVTEGGVDREKRGGGRSQVRLRVGDDELAGLFEGEHGVEYCSAGREDDGLEMAGERLKGKLANLSFRTESAE
jgi:hypothetical protein